jgi:hypothetical protein
MMSALRLQTCFAGQKFCSRSHDAVIRVYDAGESDRSRRRYLVAAVIKAPAAAFR